MGDPMPLTGDRPTAAGHRLAWRCPHGDAAVTVTARTHHVARHIAALAWQFHRAPALPGGGCTDPLPTAADDPWGTARAAITLELDRRGMRQVALAAALGLSPKHVNQVLTGAVTSPAALTRIARHLGLTFTLAPTDPRQDTPDGP